MRRCYLNWHRGTDHAFGVPGFGFDRLRPWNLIHGRGLFFSAQMLLADRLALLDQVMKTA
jgi:hypothetical protein